MEEEKKYNSEEPNEIDSQDVELEDVATPEDVEMQAEECGDEVGKLEKELENQKREYMFLMAEFDNFRKRTIREKSEIIKNASEKVLSGLLPIVDDFERGLEATKDSDDAESVKQGMELIYNKLIKFLEQNGVKAINSTGEDFNPDMHEAIAMVPVDDDSLKGKVIDTPTKGYTINDKVLRHAKVAVGQ